MKRTLAVLGAGPVGLEAAFAARARGFEVSCYERGKVADSVQRWGHVRMFSPFAMNASPAGRAALTARGWKLPEPDALLTGAEFVARYLAPLAECLDDVVQADTAVLAVGREGARKADKIGAPDRAETPFRLLVERGGAERFVTADYVLDCTGTFTNPHPLGEGGLPALAERRLGSRITYGIADAGELTGSRVLVVGGGHSAATMVRDLAPLAGAVIWAVRDARAQPCARIAGDPLPARDQLCAETNALAASLQFLRSTTVHALEEAGDAVRVTLRCGQATRAIEVDHIVAATGFRPDLSITRELQLQTCWATEGTYKLAAMLLGEAGGDCLTAPVAGAEALTHPEPGFFTLGMKSYGRTPDFLLRNGLAQITAVLDVLPRVP